MNAAAKRISASANAMLSSVVTITSGPAAWSAWIPMITADPAPKFAPKNVQGKITNRPSKLHRLLARCRTGPRPQRSTWSARLADAYGEWAVVRRPLQIFSAMKTAGAA
jgi:hypothetical protein